MIANYHTHTWRCRHAVGEDEDYVNRAIAGGLDILGFSDHTPYPFTGGHYSSFRMYPHQLADYCRSITGLASEYAGDIRIALGVEAEYYPDYFPELMAMLRDSPVEYMILGQHFLGSEVGQPYSGTPTQDERLLEQYCNQVIDALHTGLFTYVAHPELLRFVGSPEAYRRQMRRLCRAAAECGIPLEINGLGIRENRHYPDMHFWELAAEEGCTAVFGCDAHRPEDVCDTQSLAAAQEIARRFSLEIASTVPLVPLG